jgi:hypothetical protein
MTDWGPLIEALVIAAMVSGLVLLGQWIFG